MLLAKSSVGPALSTAPASSPPPCRNPIASSSSWPGVRIVTASARPRTRISNGSSIATRSSTPSSRSTGAWVSMALRLVQAAGGARGQRSLDAAGDLLDGQDLLGVQAAFQGAVGGGGHG